MTSRTFRYGDLIRETRVEMGLTQRHVADQCGISDSALAHIERELRLPSEAVANQIADVLGFSPKVRNKFETGLQAIRERQARERVRNRDAQQKAIHRRIGGAAPKIQDITQDLANDAELREACHYLKKALTKRSQRKVIISALKAWAANS